MFLRDETEDNVCHKRKVMLQEMRESHIADLRLALDSAKEVERQMDAHRPELAARIIGELEAELISAEKEYEHVSPRKASGRVHRVA